MVKTLPFDEHVREYEEWFRKYPCAFKSQVIAIKQLLPKGENLLGIEIGVGTGRFAKALGIKEGTDVSKIMRAVAQRRGILVLNSTPENLPYKSSLFDYAFMNLSACYLDNMHDAFTEAYRILKKQGVFVMGFIDKNSVIGKYHQHAQQKVGFYLHAKFYSADQIARALKKAGFEALEFAQTLFHDLKKIKSIETPETGYGKGLYVLIKAIK